MVKVFPKALWEKGSDGLVTMMKHWIRLKYNAGGLSSIIKCR